MGPVLVALPALLVLLLISSESWAAHARIWAWAAVDICVLSGALALTARRGIHRLAQQALQSREVFLSNFAKAQRLMQRHALAADCLLLLGAGAMAVAIGALDPYREYYYALLIVAAIFVPYALYKLLKHARPILNPPALASGARIAARALTRAQAPALWALVDEASARAKTAVPDHIVIGLDSSFYAADAPLYLNRAETPLEGRSLFLSVPYLAYMTREELAVVVAQELAHFTGGEVKRTHQFAEVYAQISHYMSHLHAEATMIEQAKGHWWGTPARKLVGFFLTNFTPALDQWAAERTYVVDALGSAAASPQSAALALLRLTTLASVIQPLLAEFAHNGGRSPHPDGLLASVFEAVSKAPTLDPLAHLDGHPFHPREAQPCTRQRIEMLGVPVTAELAQLASNREPSGLLEELGLR
ncbi:hypothetical protein AXK11_00725 [Cephaloticoccus primus]|uniref:Peptidase M48 domain-containing protein n=1 Tax=Cephaloticoccus primus TaxID=1548207 RepID=A0A139SJL9_9BACT|nr:hypothetical protein AXK11_00725 [Cephaloticoccus primus]